jgi:hypothetical protein
LHFSTVSSGTVTINEDSSLQVLAEEAVPLEQLDMSVSDCFTLLCRKQRNMSVMLHFDTMWLKCKTALKVYQYMVDDV